MPLNQTQQSTDRASAPIPDPRGKREAGEADPAPILELDDVSYAYSKGGKRVLQHISHRFEPGKVYAITGPSGAGKTTMLSLISALTCPTEGKVMYRGRDLSRQDRYRYRSRDIGVIFQSFNLLPSLTVLENIVLSMDASGKHFDQPKKDMGLKLLERVHLPAEYANERILHLSGGEQQRVAIARAFSYDPEIIVADEPTGNLDLATQEDIMAIFRALAHDNGRCVIIVTHSPEVARASDEIFELAPLRHQTRRQPARPARVHGDAR
ncbi:MAG: ABC transporter ATP-binding protein [Bifidobacterium sp.]|jgi:putative ABC transport system ATP-binding protein|nr:ABC transporter ATP-binding protein [Bifidobacterium sp.]MCI1864568.1 ABC transporter ATP-binding protein [Bifidobacterium sp.]